MQDSPHILVVDDDREIRDLLSRFLGKHGFRVTVARDGREMKQALADRRIDLVVLDLMLPGEGGLSLCRDLRARSAVPIIMLTAMREETDRVIGLEMGADDYLAKPLARASSWPGSARCCAAARTGSTRRRPARNRSSASRGGRSTWPAGVSNRPTACWSI